MSTTIQAVAKPFSGHPRSTYTFRVDADGTVRVWDSIAGHYTTCHSMAPAALRRIRAMAEAQS